jgi:MinD superfamily P-loop ATPase
MTAPHPHSLSLPLVDGQAAHVPAPELVVISGKGGTGKTSIVASLAVLAEEVVLADCDVDAADLHLVLEPTVVERHSFDSGHEAVIRPEDCDACGICHEVCRFDAVQRVEEPPGFRIDPIACEGCGVCVHLCPRQAIDFSDRRCGDWFLSDTRCGPMVHARLGIAAENSGKLVTLVRDQAKQVSQRLGRTPILIDGPPGIGCPVIASITGASGVLIVTEPTVSGLHDMTRVLQLTRHFGIRAAVCVNRWDLHPEGARRIEELAREHDALAVGRIRYDPTVTRAQVEARAVVELDGPAADDIRDLWLRLGPWWLNGEGHRS